MRRLATLSTLVALNGATFLVGASSWAALSPTAPGQRLTAHPPHAAAAPAVHHRPSRRPLTPRQLLRRAVHKIPTYRPGLATWSMPAHQTHWGTTNLGAHTIWINPAVPAPYMYDVVVHEWSHVLSIQPYGGDGPAAIAAMNRVFGGAGTTGAERAADCMARAQGAGWTFYTPCTNPVWRAAARRLLAGKRI